MDDTIMAIASLVSLIEPIQAACHGTKQGFTNVKKVSEIIGSFRDWMKGEAASIILQKEKVY